MIDYWHDMSILVGGLEVAGHGKNVNVSVEADAKDRTPLSTTGYMVFGAGLKHANVELDLMADMAAGSIDETLWTLLLANAAVPKSIVSRSADGSVAYLMNGLPLSYTPLEASDPGETAMAHLSGASTSPVARGLLLHPGATARSTSSTGVARQLGAVPAGKSVYAALHVLSASGTTPSLTVTLQSDNASNFPSPTSRVSFAAKTTGNTYEWGSAAGAITDDWWRVSWTISGTSPSFLFAVTAGII